jgi:hypothetical protein
MITVIKNILKLPVYFIFFLWGILQFLITRKTNNQSYLAFRYFFVFTNGKMNDWISKVISWWIPAYPFSKREGVLGTLSNEEINSIAAEIDKNGFYVFKNKLSQEVVAKLNKFASETPVRYLQFDRKYITYSEDQVLFDEKNPISPRFQFTSEQLLENPTVQNLLFDQSLLSVATRYLKTKPILDIITMWWSLPFSKEAEDRAAQKFHFDMDRFKFIKFFFYLNDVGPQNGPHCYVKGSLRNIPKPILQDRRIEDDEIAAHYPSSDIIELTGSAGTIMAVDTRGFHKGKSLLMGKRLLLQLQFSNSVFGAPYEVVCGKNVDPIHQNTKSIFHRTYQLIR